MYRNPIAIEASNFGGTSDQLFLGIFMQFSHKMPPIFLYHRAQKKVKNNQKRKSRGGKGNKVLSIIPKILLVTSGSHAFTGNSVSKLSCAEG